MAELHTGLDDDADHALERAAEPVLGEDFAMRRDRLERGVRGSRGEAVQVVERAAGRGNFGANDIDGRRKAGASRIVLGDSGEACRPAGRHLVAERLGLAQTPHAGIEMDLGKASRDIFRDHGFSLRQRGFRRQRPPRIRAEMVAAENQARRIELHPFGDAEHEIAKVGRPHSRIAAVLVDLVAGRLDEHWAVVIAPVPQRSFDDDRMCGADRRYAGIAADAAQGGKLGDNCAHLALRGGVLAIKASSSANEEVPSIGPLIVTVRAPAALA
jgi:hypothetical protein